MLLLGVLAAAPVVGLGVQRWIGSGERVLVWSGDLPADRVRLGVRDEGVYRVAAGEIAQAAGVATNDVLAALANANLILSNNGREVAWTTNAACDALLFYAVPATDIYAPENVYWLDFGAGCRMERLDAAPVPGAVTNAWFMRTESYRSEFLLPNDSSQRRSTKGTITNVLNFGRVVRGSTTASKRRVDQILEMPGYEMSAATGVTVRAHLCSYGDINLEASDTHKCEIWVNGISCGLSEWSGEKAAVYEHAVPDGALTNETPLMTVSNRLYKEVNTFMILDIEMVYPCSYVSADGLLLCAGGTGGVTRVSGFGSGALRVWDVTEADTPWDLAAPVWQDGGGDWQTAFLSGDSAVRYAVFEENAGCFLPAVSGVRDIAWNDPAEMPEMAIIVPPRRWITGFAEAVQPLADFRNAQGLVARIIDAEDIYNAFSSGLVHPEAFRRFAAAGVTNGPQQRLRYMLFAGYGGSDYKLEVFGFSGTYPNFFPLYLVPHVSLVYNAALLLPNDPVLGDVAGDAVPEVAVGRFIATSAAELSNMVNKTIHYEITETWKNKAFFFGDVPDKIGTPYEYLYDFTTFASNTSLKFVSGGWSADTIFADQDDLEFIDWLWDDGQDGAYYKLLEGVGFFYFIGHANDVKAGGRTEGPNFITSDILWEADWQFAPAALLISCRLGRWTHYGGVNIYSINEAGVRNPVSGFSAVISPAGYMQPEDARDYSYAFGAAVAAGALRLGDAWRGTFENMGGTASERLRHMTFLGDPALVFRAGQTARGTSAAWLISHGLTGDPYADLLDQDGDGFVTWLEYLADTNPVRGGGIWLRSLAGLEGAASSGALQLSFEAVAGRGHQILSSTNLTSGVWDALQWRSGPEAAWTTDAIAGDWPLKSVEIPYNAGERRRFYKVVAE